MSAAGPNRLQRLLGGWSANLAQIILSIVQQLALVPIFLHYRSSDTLAAWLALYAAGSLVLVADAGLMLRAVNRFLPVEHHGNSSSCLPRAGHPCLARVQDMEGRDKPGHDESNT